MRPTAVLLALAMPATALAVPMQLDHQGRLFDGSGAALVGSHDVELSLYDSQSASTALWSEEQTLGFDNGYYRLVLGADTSNALDDATFDGDLWLGIAVDGTLLPDRTPVSSVPFAIRAGTATNLSGGVVDATELRIDGTTVIDNTGAIHVSALPVGSSASEVAPGDHLHGFAQITGLVSASQLPVGTGSTDVAAGDHIHPAADATTLDGLDSTDFADSGHTHVAGDADTLDGRDSADFADSSHGHSIDFSDLSGTVARGQLPTSVPTAPAGTRFEYGTLTGDFDAAFTPVTFGTAFSSPPVVLINATTTNGTDQIIVRVQNVSTTGFEFQVDEAPPLDGNHTSETYSWAAIGP